MTCTGGPISGSQFTARYVKATNTCTLSTDTSSLSGAGDMVFFLAGGPYPPLVDGRQGVGTGWSVTNFSVCNLGDGSGDLGAAQCQVLTPPEGTDLTAILEWDSSNPASPAASDRRMVAVYQLNGSTMTLQSASVLTYTAEIDLKANFQHIASGDTTPSTADHTDFGSAAVTGGMVTRTFTIVNETLNGGTLILGSNAVSTSGNSDFTVSAQPPTTLAPGSFGYNETTFQIIFDPSSNGVKTATVLIDNSDPDENPYTFAIQGTGTGAAATPEIEVRGNSTEIISGDTTPSTTDGTDFGSVATGANTAKTFSILDRMSVGGPELVLGANAVSITGSSDFAVTTQPDTTITTGAFDPGFTTTVITSRQVRRGSKRQPCRSTITTRTKTPTPSPFRAREPGFVPRPRLL